MYFHMTSMIYSELTISETNAGKGANNNSKSYKSDEDLQRSKHVGLLNKFTPIYTNQLFVLV